MQKISYSGCHELKLFWLLSQLGDFVINSYANFFCSGKVEQPLSQVLFIHFYGRNLTEAKNW